MNGYLGIDLGGTNIKAGVVNEDCEIIGRGEEKTKLSKSPEEIMDAMARCAGNALLDAGLTMEQMEWIGIGVPGTVDPIAGMVEYANNLPFAHVPMREYLEKKCGRRVFLENDANAAALGESLAGAAKGYRDAVVVTLGTGVGGGILIGGRLHSGCHFAGAELGHMGIVYDGRPCTCGRRGCLEAYASATGLVRSTKEAMLADPASLMWELCQGDLEKAGGRTAFIAERAGDAAGAQVVKDYISFLAYGLANVINILGPEILVLGGGVSHEGEILRQRLWDEISPQLYMKDPKKQAKLALATLGNDAGIIGAAFLGKHQSQTR